MNETDNQIRLKRMKEAIEAYQTQEITLIKELASVSKALKDAREKYEILFVANENAERQRKINQNYNTY